MSGGVLVFNAGSSSIKFSFFEAENLTFKFHGAFEEIMKSPTLWVKDPMGKKIVSKSGFSPGYSNIIARLFELLGPIFDGLTILAAGHRVVHGGNQFLDPLIVDKNNLEVLRSFSPLAPLHQPFNLAVIEAFTEHHPHLPQVACFDTAFHRTQPRLAELFALPLTYTNEGVLRYGFHGLSYQYIASILPTYASGKEMGRVIVSHLGNGASMCAMKNLKSVATTMGFTALDGLMMGTRCGNIDPGVLLYLLQSKGMSVEDVTTLFYEEAGLKGVSGISNNMRVLLESDKPEAKLAVDLFCYQAARQLCGLIPTLSGLDVLVFTAGIGENSPDVRHQICQYLSWLGVLLDEDMNRWNKPKISHPLSKIDVYVIPTNEELMIAQQTKAACIDNRS